MKSPRDLLAPLLDDLPDDMAAWVRAHRVPLAAIESMRKGTWDDEPVVDCLRVLQHFGATITVRSSQGVLAVYRAAKNAKPGGTGRYPQDTAESLVDILRHLMGTSSPAAVASRSACTSEAVANLANGRVDTIDAITHFVRVVIAAGGGSVTVVLADGQAITINPPGSERTTRSATSIEAIMALVNEKTEDGRPKWTYKQIGAMLGVSKQSVFSMVKRRQTVDNRSGTSDNERATARLRLSEEFVEYRP